jgi:hypothetical protein
VNTVHSTRNNPTPALWLAVLLALVAACAYMLIDVHVLATGDLQPSEGPPTIILAAAGCYLLGGILILLRRPWLWTLGAVVNALVILFFFRMYQSRPSVLLSPGGLASKAAQVFLELTLLYLILSEWLRSRRGEHR